MISAIYLSPSLLAVKVGGLPLVFGMTILAGLFEALLSRLLPRLRVVFPPLVCGFIVAAVGIELGLIGVSELLDVSSHETLARFHRHVGVSALTLGTMVALAVWGWGIIRLLCSLTGVLAGFGAAALTGLVSPKAVDHVLRSPVRRSSPRSSWRFPGPSSGRGSCSPPASWWPAAFRSSPRESSTRVRRS